MIKLVVTAAPGPETDAQNPQGQIYVRGGMGEPGLISGPGLMQRWIRCAWVASDSVRFTAMTPGLAAGWMLSLPVELLGQGPLRQGLFLKA